MGVQFPLVGICIYKIKRLKTAEAVSTNFTIHLTPSADRRMALTQSCLKQHHNLLWCCSALKRPITTVSTVFTNFKELLPVNGEFQHV
jgi:hypothetical protein